jgi:hypothetical protein
MRNKKTVGGKAGGSLLISPKGGNLLDGTSYGRYLQRITIIKKGTIFVVE